MHFRPATAALVLPLLGACDEASLPPGTLVDAGAIATLGQEHAGGASYDDGVSTGSGSCGFPSTPTGPFYVGVGPDFNAHAELCGACLLVKAQNGNALLAEVVTWGVVAAPNNIDLSRSAFDALFGAGAPMSPMTWAVAPCDRTDPIRYVFLTGANVDWTGLQVRNLRLPVTKLEVKSARHASFTELERQDWNDFVDASGFGTGPFTLRVTAIDGQTIEDTFPAFTPGGTLTSHAQFQ